MKLTTAHAASTVLLCSLALVPACEKKPQSGTAPAAGASTPAAKPDSHAGHDHDHDHGGAVIELGAIKIGSFDVKVTRDKGEVVAGKDAAIDASITPGAGGAAKPTAVRFWIGTEDAKGSVKAKAEIENAKEPDRWHTHAEVPSPIPAGSKLWIEIEDDKGGKNRGTVDLKM